MAKTQTQLVARVLSLLKAVGVGETPSAEDTALVNGVIEDTVADLAARDIYYVDDTDAIEEAVFGWLAIAVAGRMTDFGTPLDPGAMSLAEARLRQIKGPEDVGPEMVGEYY